MTFERTAIRKDLTGQRFGRLLVLWPSGKTKRGYVWAAQCDDGNVIHRTAALLLRGTVRSCGCLQKEWAAQQGRADLTTHGRSRTQEAAAYYGACDRCLNIRSKYWKRYGGRGIQFRFASFEDFFAHIGPKASPELELDRTDNDGHYEIGNVRWATPSQSNKNRRMPWKKAN